MNDELISMLQQLDSDTVTERMDDALTISLDQEVKERIKKKAFKKSGLQYSAIAHTKKKSTRMAKRNMFLASAAMFSLLLIGALLNKDAIAQAVNSLLTFTPTQGFVETPKDVSYSFPYGPDSILTEDEEYQLVITNSYISKDKLYVHFDFASFDDKGIETKNFPLTATINQVPCNFVSGSMERKGKGYYQGTYIFEKNDTTLTNDSIYTVSYHDLKNSYFLRKSKTVDSYNEIGNVVTHNGYSFVATYERKEDEFTAYVYPTIQTTSLSLSSPKYVYLETSQGVIYANYNEKWQQYHKQYKDGVLMPDNTTNYTFKVPKDVTIHALHIPEINYSYFKPDAKTFHVTIPMPKNGETISLNQTFDLENLSLKLTDAKVISKKNGSQKKYYLKINFENHSKDNKYVLTDIWEHVKDEDVSGMAYEDDFGHTKYLCTGIDENIMKKDTVTIETDNFNYDIHEDYVFPVN